MAKDLVQQKQYTLEELASLRKALGLVEKNDPASTAQVAPTLHGPSYGGSSDSLFGIFSDPGIRPEMLSTLVRPRSMVSVLPIQPSRFTTERLEVSTGQTAGTGTNAASFVGNPPSVGQGKVARMDFNWGSYYVKTDLEALPLVGQFKDRADVPRNILNAGPNGNPLIPEIMFQMGDTTSHLKNQFYRIGVDLGRTMEHVVIQGDSSLASANSQLGWFEEFDGLDKFIKTGYTDAKTGMLAPALDSAVINFAADVDGTIGGGDGRNFVQAFSDLIYGLKDRGDKMGMGGVQWAVVCRSEAFKAIADVYACNYATYRCDTSAAGNPVNRSDETTNRLRLEMLGGQYLLVDGERIPVIFSEGIQQDIIGSYQFNSDLKVVPISWAGMPLTYLDYFPMNNPAAAEFAQFVGPDIGYLNNGMYIVGKRGTGLAMEYHFGSRFRLLLEAPFLAGRMDNITYTFRAPIRNSDPNDTYFYANGGVTYRSS